MITIRIRAAAATGAIVVPWRFAAWIDRICRAVAGVVAEVHQSAAEADGVFAVEDSQAHEVPAVPIVAHPGVLIHRAAGEADERLVTGVGPRLDVPERVVVSVIDECR